MADPGWISALLLQKATPPGSTAVHYRVAHLDAELQPLGRGERILLFIGQSRGGDQAVRVSAGRVDRAVEKPALVRAGVLEVGGGGPSPAPVRVIGLHPAGDAVLVGEIKEVLSRQTRVRPGVQLARRERGGIAGPRPAPTAARSLVSSPGGSACCYCKCILHPGPGQCILKESLTCRPSTSRAPSPTCR